MRQKMRKGYYRFPIDVDFQTRPTFWAVLPTAHIRFETDLSSFPLVIPPPLDLFHPGRISFFQLFFFLFIFLHICRQTIVAQWKFACRTKRDDCDTGMSQRGYHLTGTRDMLQWPRSSQPEKRVRNVEQCNVYSTLYPWKFLNFNFSCQWTFRRKIIFPRIYSPSRSWWK